MFKKIRIEFYKTKGGGCQWPFINFIKKTGNLVSDRFPKSKSITVSSQTQNLDLKMFNCI